VEGGEIDGRFSLLSNKSMLSPTLTGLQSRRRVLVFGYAQFVGSFSART
jgi:hypothetical protein